MLSFPLENMSYNMLPYCLLSAHYILVVSKQRTQHTEVVHAPQACIFHALKVRGIHIFLSSCHFVAKQVMCAWQNMLNVGKKNYQFNVFVMYALDLAHEKLQRMKWYQSNWFKPEFKCKSNLIIRFGTCKVQHLNWA